MYGELDTKLTMRYVQSLIQMTLLKIHAAVMAARMGRPSPYTFSSKDLDEINLSKEYHDKRLTSQIDDVSATIAIVENKYTFIMAVPVKTEDSQFQILKVRKLPIFRNNVTYNIKTSGENYGINIRKNEFRVLSEKEYLVCAKDNICLAPGPVFTVKEDSPCEITSFFYNTQSCPLEVAQPAGPHFLTMVIQLITAYLTN